MDKTDIMGLSFDNVTMEEAVGRAYELMRQPGCAYIATPNAEIAYCCMHDADAMRAVGSADMLIPDGIGIVKAAAILGTPLKERVPGIELGERILPLLAADHGKLFILGGRPGIAEKAAARLSEKYPGLVVCGCRDGFFEENDKALAEISDASPDLLYVCLGAPRQEKWMYENRGSVAAKLMIGLGGSVDFYAGEAPRAPLFFRKLGLEWLYRLIRQPSRLGRMLVIPKYLRAVKRYKKEGCRHDG